MSNKYTESNATGYPIIFVKGATIQPLLDVVDMRGHLSVVETGQQLRFEPKRLFFVYDVPSAELRGQHAHKECHQFLVCMRGSISVLVDDGSNRQEIKLNQPALGLYIEPGVWATQYNYSSDAVLAVLASHPYDEQDYIRNYDDYREWLKK